MFNRLLKMPWVLNMLGFWIWHDYICKGYREFWVCPNMAQYATIMPEYDSLCLNVPHYVWKCLNTGLNMADYCWMFLNISENAWINCPGCTRFSIYLILDFWQGFEYARVLDMLQYSYNNIIMPGVVACTFNPAILEAKFWKSVVSISVGDNSPSKVGGLCDHP